MQVQLLLLFFPNNWPITVWLAKKNNIYTYKEFVSIIYQPQWGRLSERQNRRAKITMWKAELVIIILITRIKTQKGGGGLFFFFNVFPPIFEFKLGLSCHHDSDLAPWQLPLFCISARRQTAVTLLIRLLLY